MRLITISLLSAFIGSSVAQTVSVSESVCDEVLGAAQCSALPQNPDGESPNPLSYECCTYEVAREQRAQNSRLSNTWYSERGYNTCLKPGNGVPRKNA